MLKQFLVCVILLSGLPVQSQECTSIFNPKKQLAASTYLCVDAMQADLAQVHKHILQTHPNPTYYNSSSALIEAYNRAKKACEQPRTVLDFMFVVNSYLNSLKDSHTGLNPKDFLYQVNAKRMVLPFFVTEIDNKFYLFGGFSDQLKRGDEILEIDQYPISQLYEMARALSMCEGDAQEAQNEVALDYIGVAYNLLEMSLNEPKTGTFKVVKPAGDTSFIEVPFVATWKYFFASMSGQKDDVTSFYFDEKNRGVLVVNSFQPLSLPLFQKKIDEFFSEVEKRKCEQIYIDLRDNLGGLLRAEEYLFSFINTESLSVKTDYLYKRSNYDRFALLSPIQEKQFVNRAKNVYPNGLISKEYDFYRMPKGSTFNILYDYVPANARNYIYKGKCALVLNGSSMSASVLFAAWFKHIERGDIIGTTCMGGMGGTFGNPAAISLDHSNISVIVSTLKFTPLHIKEKVLRPIVPDIWLKASRQDLLDHVDPFQRYLEQLN
ncbi:MAG: S41 family peptidase [Flavobacteriales bacterium]